MPETLATLAQLKDGAWCVRYLQIMDSAPKQRWLHWRIAKVTQSWDRGAACQPKIGDSLQDRHGGVYIGPGYSVRTVPNADSEETTEWEDIPPPKTRGKPTRWYQGRWQKLMARGWVDA